MVAHPTNSRLPDRRRVDIGEGLGFQIESETARMEAEAIDLAIHPWGSPFLFLRVLQCAAPSLRSLCRPVDEVLAFAA
jgi:hypothetical protein